MPPNDAKELARLANSVKKGVPMFRVQNMRATVGWYRAIGFTVTDEYEDSGDLVFAMLSFGQCEFALSPGATTGPTDVSLWFYTDQVQALYEHLKNRHPAVAFEEDLYTPFYGGQQFSIRDINGLTLIFWHPDWLLAAPPTQL